MKEYDSEYTSMSTELYKTGRLVKIKNINILCLKE